MNLGKFLGIQVMNGQKKSSHTHGMYRQVGNWETFAAHAFSGLHFRKMIYHSYIPLRFGSFFKHCLSQK